MLTSHRDLYSPWLNRAVGSEQLNEFAGRQAWDIDIPRGLEIEVSHAALLSAYTRADPLRSRNLSFCHRNVLFKA